jgi:hypothetical protein
MYLFVAMQMIHILSVVVGVSTLGGVSKPPWCRISRMVSFCSLAILIVKSLDLLNAFEPVKYE